MQLPIRYFYCALLFGMIVLLGSCERDLENILDDNDLSAEPLSEDIRYPNDNLYSVEKFNLGQNLFWDPILSGPKSIACATCHHPNFGWADGRALSSGVGGIGLGPERQNGIVVSRNAPTILNTAFNGIDINGNYNPVLAPMFWDNRAHGLEEQALLPMLSNDEMRGNEIAENDILDTIVLRLNAIPSYRNMFEQAFGNQIINEGKNCTSISNFSKKSSS